MKKSFLTWFLCFALSLLYAQQPVELVMQFPDDGSKVKALSTEITRFQQLAADSNFISDSLVFHVNVPDGTNECWLVGNFCNWDNAVHQMMKIDDHNYTITLYNLSADSIEYKYLSGPGDWVYVEKNADMSEVMNRLYQPYDTVAAWNVVYEPQGPPNGRNITFEVTVPFNVNEVYVTGNFNNWTYGDYSYRMDPLHFVPTGKVFRKTVWVNYPDVLEYKFAAGPDWYFEQYQSNNYKIPQIGLDTIRHRVMHFKNYSMSAFYPRNWCFSDHPFYGLATYTEPTDLNGLRVYGAQDIPMYIDMNNKRMDQMQFSYRLHTGGPGRCDPEKPLKPVKNGIAVSVGEDAQVLFNALSDGTENAVLLITNGVDTLAWANVPPSFELNPEIAPAWSYRYQGPPTTLYLYSTNVGVNFYMLGVTDSRELPYEGPQVTYTVKVPSETRQVMLAGEFNYWDPMMTWMNRIDSVTFTTTIRGATPEMEYKYLSGTDWRYTEVNADGTDKANRTWHETDTVARWKELYFEEETRFKYDDVHTVLGEEIVLTIQSESNKPKEAISYQFHFYYDSNILEYTGYSTDSTVAATGTVLVNPDPNQSVLYISFMTETPFSYTSDLLKLKFKVISSNYYWETHCNFSEQYLNSQYIPMSNNGAIYVHHYKPGDVDENYMIQAYDAALTLQYSVGKDPLPAVDPLPWSSWRMKAAEVDGVAGITANDAALILQHSAMMIDHFPVEADSTNVPALVRGMVSPDITITRDKNQLLVRSYGSLMGLNLYLKEFANGLGAPQISSEIDLSAVNITKGVYSIGLAALEPPADGTVIMTIPLTDADNVDYVFTAIINTYQKDIISRVITSNEVGLDRVIQLYPNPASDYLTVSGLTEGSDLLITDISGRTVYQLKSVPESVQLPVSELPAGVYSMLVTSEGIREVARFIKQ